jgi:Tfp pilus assembly protein PilX
VSRLGDQRGIAMPLTLVVLMLVLALTAWAASSSQQLGTTSTKDRHAKRAIATADAGLQAAIRRLETVQRPVAGQCVYPQGLGTPAAGECAAAPSTVDLGGGASYSYVVTPVQTTGTCAGEAYVAGTDNRCATAVGTVAGVTRRVQARVTAQSFTASGIVGENRVELNNGINVWACPGDPRGVLGSNGVVYLNNSIELVNKGCAGGGSNGSWPTVGPDTMTETVVNGVNPSNPPTETTTTPWALKPIDPWPALAQTNNSAVVGTGSAWGAPGIAWDAAARTLYIQAETYTLPAGTYSFCSLYLGNGGALKIAGPTKIYIDSPARTGSGCAAGTGYYRAQNSNGTNWPDGANVSDASAATAARNLDMFLWGNPAFDDPATHPTFCSDSKAWGTFVACNSSGFAGTIYSPNGRVYLGHGQRFVGSIAGEEAFLNNSVDVRFPSGLSSTSDVYGMRRWTECTPAGTVTADPESGC